MDPNLKVRDINSPRNSVWFSRFLFAVFSSRRKPKRRRCDVSKLSCVANLYHALLGLDRFFLVPCWTQRYSSDTWVWILLLLFTEFFVSTRKTPWRAREEFKLRYLMSTSGSKYGEGCVISQEYDSPYFEGNGLTRCKYFGNFLKLRMIKKHVLVSMFWPKHPTVPWID